MNALAVPANKSVSLRHFIGPAPTQIPGKVAEITHKKEGTINSKGQPLNFSDSITRKSPQKTQSLHTATIKRKENSSH